MKFRTLAFGIFFSLGVTYGQTKIHFNTDAIDQYVKLIKNSNNSESFIQTKAIQEMITKTQQFNVKATRELYRSHLNKFLNNESIETNVFHIERLKQNQDHVFKFLSILKSNEERIKSEIQAKLNALSPKGIQTEVYVYFGLGGSSDAWTKQNEFYVALDFFRDDFDGVKLMMTHELYHIFQRSFFYSIDETLANYAINKFLQTVIAEGSASYVADPLNIETPKFYIRWYQGKYMRNLNTLSFNYSLFELILYRLFHDSTIDYEDVYDLGFSGRWESPMYFVGYFMTKTIEEKSGRSILLKLLTQHPTEFFKHYISIYKNDSADGIFKFSKNIESIIHESHATSRQ